MNKNLEKYLKSIGVTDNLKYLVGYNRFFGDHFVRWLREELKIPNKEELGEFEFACGLSRCYFVLNDNYRDARNKECAPPEIIGRLREDMLNRWEELTTKGFRKQIVEGKLKHVEEQHAIHKQRHWDNIETYTQKDLYRPSETMGVVDVPILAICRRYGLKKETYERLKSTVDWLFRGLQLYDDLADWKEDLPKGMFSFPTTTLALVLGEEKPTVEQLEDRFIASGVVSCSVMLAMDLFEQVPKSNSRILNEYLRVLFGKGNKVIEEYTKREFGLPSLWDSDYNTKIQEISEILEINLRRSLVYPELKDLEKTLAPPKLS